MFDLRCERSGTATFAPISELIRLAIGIDTDDDAGTRLDSFVEPDVEDRERIVGLIGSLVGAGAPRSAEETFFGVRRFVEMLAARQPVVIVVDDVQWAEPLLLDLLEHLVEWVRDAPVLSGGVGAARDP